MDFCFLGFIYMIPKLRVTIREAMLRARTDPKATASGYSHTHFDSQGLDIPALATFPSDDEINAAAKEAAEETESLLALLGISPNRLRQDLAAKLPIRLPPITFFQMDDIAHEDDDTISEAQQLQDLIRRAEKDEKDKFLHLAEATALVTVDEFMKMCVPNLRLSCWTNKLTCF
jgi:hypothetical protein